MMHQTIMGFRRDPDAVRGKHLERDLLRRVLTMTRPYRGALVGFLIAVIASAVVGIVPAFLFRALLDDAVGPKDVTLVAVLALLAVLVAFITAALSLAQRWYSSRVGEGLIYDMRVALFDHVQRLPISFFTRTQTGALTSRLNNDVIGAQQAVTNTIGTVVQNVITLGITLSEGRSFRADEIQPPAKGSGFVPQVIVSKALGNGVGALTARFADLMNITVD